MKQAQDSSTTVVIVGDGGKEAIVGRVPDRAPDLALVEALARLALDARRGGWSLRVRHPSPGLCELLELVGLIGALGVEPRWEPEPREQLGPEKVVEPGDLSA